MSAKSSAAKKETADKKQTFEGAMERLEAIVAQMEDGGLELEDMIARFEEGQGLLAFCTKKLNEIEKKVERLVDKDDATATAPLDEPDADDEPADEDDDSEEELF